MKKLITAILLTAVLVAPAFAGSGHAKMHSHMKEMQKLMVDIKQEQNATKRHQMMKSHMESMQKGMHMMKNSETSSVDLKTRVGMLEQRSKLMQEMMLQMMEYSAEADSAFENSIIEGGSNR
jgi:hypothetical protein